MDNEREKDKWFGVKVMLTMFALFFFFVGIIMSIRLHSWQHLFFISIGVPVFIAIFFGRFTIIVLLQEWYRHKRNKG
jgi:hypothetical protein